MSTATNGVLLERNINVPRFHRPSEMKTSRKFKLIPEAYSFQELTEYQNPEIIKTIEIKGFCLIIGRPAE